MRYNCRTEIMNFISKFDINQLEESSDLIWYVVMKEKSRWNMIELEERIFFMIWIVRCGLKWSFDIFNIVIVLSR